MLVKIGVKDMGVEEKPKYPSVLSIKDNMTIWMQANPTEEDEPLFNLTYVSRTDKIVYLELEINPKFKQTKGSWHDS